jgi:hypothetical protein
MVKKQKVLRTHSFVHYRTMFTPPHPQAYPRGEVTPPTHHSSPHATLPPNPQPPPPTPTALHALHFKLVPKCRRYERRIPCETGTKAKHDLDTHHSALARVHSAAVHKDNSKEVRPEQTRTKSMFKKRTVGIKDVSAPANLPETLNRKARTKKKRLRQPEEFLDFDASGETEMPASTKSPAQAGQSLHDM